MLSGVISSHQSCDDRRRRVTNRRSREFDSSQALARPSCLNIESAAIKKITVEDAVSETTLKSHFCSHTTVQAQIEQHETYPVSMKNLDHTDDVVKVKVDKPKPKKNCWKWIAGLGLTALGTAGIYWASK